MTCTNYYQLINPIKNPIKQKIPTFSVFSKTSISGRNLEKCLQCRTDYSWFLETYLKCFWRSYAKLFNFEQKKWQTFQSGQFPSTRACAIPRKRHSVTFSVGKLQRLGKHTANSWTTGFSSKTKLARTWANYSTLPTRRTRF